MPLKMTMSVMLLLLVAQNLMAKDWRGVVPLKSTRMDVERRFGRPDRWGDYEFKDERISVEYSDGPCKGLYEMLGKDNCKCLVQRDTVMSIFVEPIVKRKFSDLKLEFTKFKRTAIAPFPHTFEYYNPTEGIDYTVDESENEVKHITYYPSPLDCEEISKRLAPIYRNSWRGLRPLHSSRNEVERLLGHLRMNGTHDVYRTDHETVSVKYSNGTCKDPRVEWRVQFDTILELTVTPRLSFRLSKLDLDLSKYLRQELFPLPETPNSLKVVNYVNDDGVTIRSEGPDGIEEVISITYRPSVKDNRLRCSYRTPEARKKQ